MTDLGLKCVTTQVAVKGDTSVAGAKKVVDDIILAIGMTPIFEPKVFQYEDKVGLIYIQPIYESFVAYDAWPCHGGGYITVTSCRGFKVTDVLTAIKANGYQVTGFSSNVLEL